MKHILFLLLVIAGFAGELSGQDFYSYTPDGKAFYQLSTERILLRFDREMTTEQRQGLFRKWAMLPAYSEEMELDTPQVTLVKLDKQATKEKIRNMLAGLSKTKGIQLAYPVLVYKDGASMAFVSDLAVGLKAPGDFPMLQQRAAALKLKVKRRDSYTPTIFYLQTTADSPGNALEMANALAESGEFAFAEPDFLRLNTRQTNDPLYYGQWAISNTGQWQNSTPGADMDVDQAWTVTGGNSNIWVAILDDGVQLNHPDLAANIVGGYDATGQGSNGAPSQATDAHGTNCAGIVGAVANNGIGVTGIAPLCKIMAVRIAYNESSSGWISSNTWVAEGINWAWQNGADVLSNSYGGGSSSSLINTAISNAVTSGRQGKGAPVLFASGNNNSSSVNYPASNTLCIAVGATSPCDERKSPGSCDGETTWGSNYNTGLDVSAPGVLMTSTDLTGSGGYNSESANYPFSSDYYGYFNGTSSACPAASAVMALILSVNPDLTQTQARAILESSCSKVGGYSYSTTSGNPNGTWSSQLGYGRINAFAAVQMAQGNSACNAPTTAQISAINITTTTARLTCSVTGVQAYDWAYRAVGSSTWINLPGSTVNYIDLSDLSPGTQYQFVVAVRCDASTWSEWSDADTFSTTSATCTAPSTSQISATNITNTSVRLNCSVTGVQAYDWAYRVAGSSTWTDLPGGTANFIDVTDLTPGTQYQFIVSVRCDATQWSSWSSAKTFTTTAATCNAPTASQLSATNITSTTARLNCSVTGMQAYDWAYREAGSSTWIDLPGGTANNIELTNLTPGTQYQFIASVRCDATTWSEWSAAKNFTTGAPACNAPLAGQISVTNITATTVRLNCSVTGVQYYDWSYRALGSSSWTSIPAGSANYYDLTNLTPGTQYQFRAAVRCDASTWSEWSPAGSFTTAQEASSLTMSTNISVTPLPVIQGQPAAAAFNVVNNSSSGFNGEISIDLYNGAGEYLGEIANKTALSLCAGCSFTSNLTYNFTLTDPPGDYFAAAWYRTDGGQWIQVEDGNFSNVVPITIISQAVTSLEVSPNALNLNALAGNSAFNISSNCNSWTITGIPAWLTLSQNAGANNAAVSLQYQANNNSQSRTATLTITGCGINRTVTVTQAGSAPTLEVDPGTFSVNATSGSVSFHVTSNCAGWSVTGMPAWLSVNPAAGSDEGTVNIQYQENAAAQPRSATLTVTGCGLTRTVTVSQAGTSVYLTLSTPALNISPGAGNTTFNISSNCAGWSVSGAPAWMTVSPGSGANNAAISIQYQGNAASVPRTATLTVSGCGFSQTLTVTQAGQTVVYPWTPSTTGDNHTVIIPASLTATVDGSPLAAGDLIGFFYETGGTLHCSNFVIWEGVNTSCAVYGNDADAGNPKNGFSDGELFKVKVYRAATQEELTAQVQYAEIGTAGIVSHTNAYADDGISMLTNLTASNIATLNIPLNPGWNMISSYVAPNPSELLQVLSPVSNQVILMKNSAGQSAIPSLGINNIGGWDIAEGYQVKVNASAVLTVSGQKADPAATPVAIAPGWQIISYLRDQPGSVPVQLAGIAGQVEIMKNNAGQTYIPGFGINNIGNMVPTQGYKLKATGNATLTYPANFTDPDEGPEVNRPVLTGNVHFVLDSTLNTGNNAAIVFPAATVSDFLSPGDEIGVFNQAGRLCGAGVYAGDNFAVTVWGDDASTSDLVEGMTVGEPYRFMIWQTAEEAETPAVVEFISGSANYEVDDLAIVGSVALNPVKTADPASDMRVSIYPNPARDWVKVDISGSIGAIRAFQLMDMHGRIVQQYAAECDSRAGCAVTLPLPRLPGGLYLLRITGDAQNLDYRIIIAGK